MPKTVYITATRPGDGSSVVTLGLTSALLKRTDAVGFIKPLGRRLSATDRLDPDVPLIEKACGIKCETADMNPLAIHTEFLQDYLRKQGGEDLMKSVMGAFNRVARGKEIIVIEGTGHAAVGSVFGLSNAYVASKLRSKVLLVTSGGLGPELDEVTLNMAMFRNYGVDVLGVVLNRVGPEEKDLLDSVGKAALEERGIRVLGIVPYRQMLETPTVREVLLATDGEVLNGEPEMENRVGGVVLGVSAPERVIHDLAPHSIVVTCSDRSDLILAALTYRLLGETEGGRLAGLVLCGDTHPDEEVLRLIRRTQVPVLLVSRDAYTAATIIRDLRGSISPGDRGKIELVQDLVARHVDVDAIYDAL